jgi:hypothetical protein
MDEMMSTVWKVQNVGHTFEIKWEEVIERIMEGEIK